MNSRTLSGSTLTGAISLMLASARYVVNRLSRKLPILTPSCLESSNRQGREAGPGTALPENPPIALALGEIRPYPQKRFHKSVVRSFRLAPRPTRFGLVELLSERGLLPRPSRSARSFEAAGCEGRGARV